jgi:ribonuclease-3
MPAHSLIGLSYQFHDEALLKTAMTHPSLSKCNSAASYETLEFLGDNVLNLMVAEALYSLFPGYDEGMLSQIHSNLVRTETLATVARKIGLSNAMLMDVGEENAGGRNNPKNLENCLEALAGAIFLEVGYSGAKEVFMPLWREFLEDENYLLKRDAKTILQEWSQSHRLGLPKYVLLSADGLAHKKIFTVAIELYGYEAVQGQGSSIKKAEGDAAQNFINLNIK